MIARWRKARGTWTPTITAGSGTITTAAASATAYQLHGRVCTWRATITITTNGTGAGAVKMTLPMTAALANVGVGRETVNTGALLSVTGSAGSATVDISKYDNTYPGANGAVLEVGGQFFV